MNCKKIRNRLSAYQDGELDEAMRAVVSEHLQQCQQCRLEYEMLIKAYQMLEADIPSIRDEQFLLRLKARLYREKAEKKAPAVPKRWIERLLVPSTAIVGLLVGAILGLHLVKTFDVSKTDIAKISAQYSHEEVLTDIPIGSITFAYNNALMSNGNQLGEE